MYGTVARLKVKAGAEEALMAQFREYSALRIPGYQRTYVYRMDNDPAEFYMAVVFDSKESYRANAEAPSRINATARCWRCSKARQSGTMARS